jgi:hypothetical protein
MAPAATGASAGVGIVSSSSSFVTSSSSSSHAMSLDQILELRGLYCMSHTCRVVTSVYPVFVVVILIRVAFLS